MSERFVKNVHHDGHPIHDTKTDALYFQHNKGDLVQLLNQLELQNAELTKRLDIDELGLDKIDKLTENVEELSYKNAELTKERNELVSQLSDMKLRNRLLRDRPDLPMERLEAYKKWEQRLPSIQADAIEEAVGNATHCSCQDYSACLIDDLYAHANQLREQAEQK